MILDCNLGQKFRNYGVLQAIQVSNEHLREISKYYEGKEILVKLGEIKLAYKFIHKDNFKYFNELCLLDRFNRILAVAYEDDYIVRDKTGIYILNKKKFEEKYLIKK